MDLLVSAIGLLSELARTKYAQVTWNELLPLDNLVKPTSGIGI